MADRELTFRILTTAETSALDETARALDDVAQASTATATDLDKLDTSAFDTLGTEAKAAASAVDTALDKVGTSAKSNLGKVDDGTDKAKAGFKDMKEEAGQTARESAASFSDVTSALDAVQEIAANAFVGFGPAGLIAGAAAASGIGLVFSGLQTAADKANEAKDRVIALAQAIRDVGGDMSKVDIPGMFADWAFAIGDNKSWWELWQKDNTTNLEIFRDKAEAAGISVKEMFDAMAGNDPQALARALDDINTRLQENTEAKQRAAALAKDDVTASNRAVANLSNERDALNEAKQAILDKAGETEAAIRLEADAALALGRTTKAEEEATAAKKARTDAYLAATDAIGGATDDITDANARAQAAEDRRAKAEEKSLGKSGDNWGEYRDVAVGSIDDVIAAQERDIKAQDDFEKNSQRVFDAVGQAGVDWALSQGENADTAMQLLADAPKKKQAQVVANYKKSGKDAHTATAEGMNAATPAIETAAKDAHEAAYRALNRRIDVPVSVENPRSAAAEAHSIMQDYLVFHPLHVDVVPRPMTGTGYGVVVR